ncbi:hypothetical protein HYW46_06510 [Candidatus Daviesbacteria bacterium]|nr:hypothetical protein [Candidatus Daviesbacteria bacterium]
MKWEAVRLSEARVYYLGRGAKKEQVSSPACPDCRQAGRQAGNTPGGCMGFDSEVNVEAANRAGLQTILFKDNESLKTELQAKLVA